VPEKLPPPLPPAERTVGQLVAETIHLYRNNFWRSLLLGIPAAALVQIVVFETPKELQLPVVAGAGSLLLSISFVGASAIIAEEKPPWRAVATGYLLAVILFPATPFFAVAFALPGVAWLALVGLGVPAAVIERRGLKESFARGIALARADYVHTLGSMATLVITFFLTRTALFFLLRGSGNATIRIGAFLADLVISPILFLGSALIYVDQRARLDRVAPAKEGGSDADLHPALEPDGAGRADAEVEPGPVARGEP
jgi:hypothetical protein